MCVECLRCTYGVCLSPLCICGVLLVSSFVASVACVSLPYAYVVYFCLFLHVCLSSKHMFRVLVVCLSLPALLMWRMCVSVLHVCHVFVSRVSCVGRLVFVVCIHAYIHIHMREC